MGQAEKAGESPPPFEHFQHTLLHRWHEGHKERFPAKTPLTHKGAIGLKRVGFREGDADAEYQTAGHAGGGKGCAPKGEGCFSAIG